MTTRTRKTTSAKPSESAAKPAEETPKPAEETPETAPMVCIATGCTDPEDDGLGVCRTHHEAGWRFVREPEHE